VKGREQIRCHPFPEARETGWGGGTEVNIPMPLSKKGAPPEQFTGAHNVLFYTLLLVCNKKFLCSFKNIRRNLYMLHEIFFHSY